MYSRKTILQRNAVPAAALVFGLAAAAAFAGDPAFLDLRGQRPVSGDAAAGKAKSMVCSACHGANGLGVSPMFPNLAGQSPTYLYVQLKSFHGGQRQDPVMAPMAAPLDDAAMRNLATYFASLPRKPGGGAAAGSRGAMLFKAGDPARGIPPCQACHGKAGDGPRSAADVVGDAPHPPWSTIPRLRGQSAVYLAKALRDFRGGARAGTSNARIMQGVAKSLDDADIQALADYLAPK